MLKPVSQDAQSERLRVFDRMMLRVAVCEHAGEGGNFRDPAAVFFLFDFNSQRHIDLHWDYTQRLPEVARRRRENTTGAKRILDYTLNSRTGRASSGKIVVGRSNTSRTIVCGSMPML